MKLKLDLEPKDMLAGAIVLVIIYLLYTGDVKQAVELIQSVIR